VRVDRFIRSFTVPFVALVGLLFCSRSVLCTPNTFAAQPTDQSIIVGMVGIMALLVGALSNRRLRSRGNIQVYLDDEQSQDEAAYDTAYIGAELQHVCVLLM
jgi:hypothetical protein